jgi:hypothetical protein
MKRRRPKALGMISSAPWLGAGVSFVVGIAGWASETPHDEASALFGTTELSVHMRSIGATTGQAGLASELLGDAAPVPAVLERTAPAAGSKLRARRRPNPVALRSPSMATNRAAAPPSSAQGSRLHACAGPRQTMPTRRSSG